MVGVRAGTERVEGAVGWAEAISIGPSVFGAAITVTQISARLSILHVYREENLRQVYIIIVGD